MNEESTSVYSSNEESIDRRNDSSTSSTPPSSPNSFTDVYYQEYRPTGSLVYTGTDLVPQPYTSDGYKGKNSISYEYVTYNDPFSTRTVIFKIPMAHLKKE